MHLKFIKQRNAFVLFEDFNFEKHLILFIIKKKPTPRPITRQVRISSLQRLVLNANVSRQLTHTQRQALVVALVQA